MSSSDQDQKALDEKDKKPQELEAQGVVPGEEVTLPQWSCRIEPPETEKTTVGQKLVMNCEGDYIEPLFSENVRVEFPEKAPQSSRASSLPNQKEPVSPKEKFKYALKILSVNDSDYQKAQFTVTSYQAGQFNQSFYLIDGKIKVEVEKTSWKVDSVLKPTKPGEKPKMYGPYGPFRLEYPIWLWVVLGLVCTLFFAFIYRFLKKHLDKKRLREELATHSTVLTPYNQFHKDSRNLRREFNVSDKLKEQRSLDRSTYLKSLDENFKLYLTREFKVPAKKWPLRSLLREIKKKHRRVYLKCSLDMQKLWQEFDRLGPEVGSLSWEDLEQVDKMTSQVVDKINKVSSIKRRRL